MFLEKIEIQGFKTFADKTTFIFSAPDKKSKGITAIVGPNGSGKSNIVDAIRWVLGEQSLKTIRGKKSTDVIFHGSPDRAQIGLASVSLYINNQDKLLPIDYKEVVITRRIYRSGESEYFLNRAKTRLVDISLLLAKCSFGQKSYSIVGQGMIDSILHSGVEERRNFFFEAAGVRHYQIKREQSIRNLEKTKISLQEIFISLKELEPRLKFLARQAKKLEKRKILEEQLRSSELIYYSNRFYELDLKLKEKDNLIGGLKSEKKAFETNILESEKQILKYQNDEFEKIENELRKKIEFARREKDKFIQNLAMIRADISLSYKERGNFDLAFLEKRLQELRDKKDELESEITKIDLEITKSEVKKRKIVLKEKVDNINQKISGISYKPSTNEAQLEIEKLFNDLSSEYALLLKEIKLAKTEQDFRKVYSLAEKINSEILKTQKKYRIFIGKDEDRERIKKELKKRDELSEIKNNLLEEITEISSLEKILEERKNIFKNNLIQIEKDFFSVKAEIKSLGTKNSQKAAGELKKREQGLVLEIKQIDKKIHQFLENLKEEQKKSHTKKQEFHKSRNIIEEFRREIGKLNSRISDLSIDRARIETRLEELKNQTRESLVKFEEIKLFKTEKVVGYEEIQKVKRNLELTYGIEPEVEKDYEEVKKRFDFLTAQSIDLEDASRTLFLAIENFDKKITTQFNSAFSKINEDFFSFFKTLFGGGEARLVKNIVKEKEEGDAEEKSSLNAADKLAGNLEIEILARPQGKKMKDIQILSGGEQALTSIALICAIISNNPSPFIILDEVEAALDEANSGRFADILKKLSHKTQFIAITHNRAIMEAARTLYGITIEKNGVSKILSLKLEEADKIGK